MFHQGDLQSGIALAVREAKPVVCFIRDDQEESTQWEDDYFDNEELRELLSNNAVALRLIAGTQEAGFLTSICPIQSFPTVIVIRNGVLQEYIVAGTSKGDFQTRLKTVVASPNSNTAPVAPVAPTTPPAAAPVPASAVQQETQTVGTSATTDHGSNQTQTPVAQYQTQQATTESIERTIRENIRHGKQPEKQATPEEKKAKQEKEDRRAMQLKIQREQKEKKEERERIRNQIKHDQEARRQRAAEEKGNLSTSSPASKKTTEEATGSNRPGKRQVLDYRLQIRLFDGSSVRNSFPPSATIRKDIRPWLESQRSDGSQPYNLKHILTPLPNRTISISEEEYSLEELELGPTASLVMVPVPSYIEAYAPSGIMDSLPGRVVSSGYGLVSGVVGGVTGMVGGFLGYGSAPAQQASTSDSASNHPSGPTTRNSQKINIRTLHDQWNDQDKNEFYNGNTLNFEPKRDDDSKDK